MHEAGVLGSARLLGGGLHVVLEALHAGGAPRVEGVWGDAVGPAGRDGVVEGGLCADEGCEGGEEGAEGVDAGGGSAGA